MSVIIIALVLLGLTFSVSAGGFFSRFNVLDGEFKRVSLGLAESCANAALLKIGQNYNYAPAAGGDDVFIGGQTCTIVSVGSGTARTIVTKADFHGAFSTMKIAANVQDPNVAYVPPTYLSGSVIVPAGANLADFHLFLDGVEINSGQTNTVSPSVSHSFSVTPPAGFTTMGWAGACALDGSITLSVGDTKSCYINYAVAPTDAKLTLVKNLPAGAPASQFVLKIDGAVVNSGSPISVTAGVAHVASFTMPASGYEVSPWSGSCNPTTGATGSLSAGQNYTCVINFTVPNTACADTLMILDRTGSLSSTDMANERLAAKGLLNLYKPLSPAPQVGVGRFGDNTDGGTEAEVQAVGQLTNDYGAEALVGDTNIKFPTATATPSNWSNSAGAFANDALFATSATSTQQQVYVNFGFSTSSIPTGSTITGIEVVVDGLAAVSQNDIMSDNFGTGSSDVNDIPNWDEEGNDSDSTTLAKGPVVGNNDSPSPDGGRFAKIGYGEWICRQVDATNYNSLMLNYYWRGDLDAEASDSGVVEYHTAGGSSSCTSSSGWSNLATHQLNNTSWSSLQSVSLPSALDNSSFFIRFRNAANSTSEDFRVDGAAFKGTRQASLSVNLSYNAGANWTNASTTIFSGAENSYTLGGAGNTWGRTWSVNELLDNKFRLRATNNTMTGILVSLNYVTVKIYYLAPSTRLFRAIDLAAGLDSPANSSVGTNLADAITVGNAELNSARHQLDKEKVLILISDGDPNEPSNPQEAVLDAADIAKLGSTKIFTIHFGSDPSGFAGQELLAALANGTSTTPTHSGHSGANHETGSADDKASAALENTDGDNFYISPTSADMAQIFTDIGKKVCPAAAGLTQAKLNVSTQVVNSNGGVSQPADFQVTIIGAAASPASFAGSSLGTEVIVSPGVTFAISETGPANYYAPQFIGCPTAIATGETFYCTIVNYDQPPDTTYIPPPPPPSNIGIGSWEESPVTPP